MGLFVNQQDKRSQLQERITAELREKMKTTELRTDASLDGVEDVEYLQHTKPTTSLAGVWLLVAIMAAGVVAFILLQGR